MQTQPGLRCAGLSAAVYPGNFSYRFPTPPAHRPGRREDIFDGELLGAKLPPSAAKAEFACAYSHLVVDIGICPDAGVKAGRDGGFLAEQRLITVLDDLHHRFDAFGLVPHFGGVHFTFILETEL